MKRLVLPALLVSLAVTPLVAQSPEGWMLRIDRSTNASDPDAAGDVKFTTVPGGFHAVNPAAAIFWHPANTATGAYTVKGTFKLMEPSPHVNYHGLIFGASKLDGAEQTYLYFLVAQNGTFTIRRRAGDRMPDPNAPARGGRGGRGPTAITEDVASRVTHAAVRQPGADGTSENTLEVRVKADAIDFVVNGTVVHTAPKTGNTAMTDGIAGIRVNHQLNVQITGFAVTK